MLASVKKLLHKYSAIRCIYNCIKAWFGFWTYYRVKSCYGKKTTVFLIPWDGSGDAYYFVLGCRHIIKEEDVVLTTSDSANRLIRLLGIKNSCKITCFQKRSLLLFASLMNDKVNDLTLTYCNSGLFEDGMQALEGIHGLQYADFYRLCGYELDYDLPDANCDYEELKKYCDELGIIHGKTVVLAPESVSCRSFGWEQWSTLIELLHENGLSVVVNASDSSLVVDGVKTALIPYHLLLGVLNEAGYFLGIRSGLCDIVAGSFCKMIVLYPKTTHGQSTYLRFYGLESFPHRNTGLIQIEVETEDLCEKVVNQILAECLNKG